jgi:intracellular multiplication protein IcmK
MTVSQAIAATTQPVTETPSTTQALQQLQQLQLMAGNQQSSGASIQPIPASNGVSTNNTPPMANQSAPNQASTNNEIFNNNIPVPAPAAPAAPAGPPPITSIHDPAFEQVTSRLFPLSTAQVVKLHEMYNVSELAVVTSPTTPPRPTATSQLVNLSTGSTPPVIRLAQGFVSSLVFLDSTGAPWPLVSYDVGDPRAFNIAWDRAGNTLMIQPSKLYTYGNLAVRLQGLNTPVMLTLIPGQKAVDYRVDLRIQGYGPNAYPTQTQNLPASANSVLLTVLDGVPPPGSKLLDVTGGPAEAWSKDDRLYIRTRLKILSPGWVAVMSSAAERSARPTRSPASIRALHAGHAAQSPTL